MSKPRSSVNAAAPSNASGTDKRTESGVDQLSYCADRNRNTMMIARAKMNGATLPAAFCCWVTPDHS